VGDQAAEGAEYNENEDDLVLGFFEKFHGFGILDCEYNINK
jgi:hypothetical protein